MNIFAKPPAISPLLELIRNLDAKTSGDTAAILQRLDAQNDHVSALQSSVERLNHTVEELVQLLTSDSIKRTEAEEPKVVTAGGYQPPSRRKAKWERQHAAEKR